jgi:hypothetical protein
MHLPCFRPVLYREPGIITLTKHPQDVENRAAATAAGAPEIEITPAMIEAGLDAYLCRCPDSLGDSLDRELISAVFTAMR